MRKKALKLGALCMASIMAFLSVGCSSAKTSQMPAKSESSASASQEVAAGTSSTSGKTELYVLAAASLTDVLTKIGENYKKVNPNVELTFSFDSSGTLKTQIEQGAPADVFISAAKKQMNTLLDENLVDKDTVSDLLENKVVLIKPKGSDLDIKSFDDTATDKVKMIAIGNEDVPVGAYTETIYKNLGLWDKIQAKANLATNVRQVLDWVATKNADCGVVYATDAAIEDKVEVVCEAPEGSCDKVIYPEGVVKSSKNPQDAKAFTDYLKTDEAKQVFEKYGFTMYKEQ